MVLCLVQEEGLFVGIFCGVVVVVVICLVEKDEYVGKIIVVVLFDLVECYFFLVMFVEVLIGIIE